MNIYLNERPVRHYKGFKLVMDGEDHLFLRIEQPPRQLDCWYTSLTIAQRSIDEFLERVETTKLTGDPLHIFRSLDKEGNRLVHVTLRDSDLIAVCDEPDFNSIVERG